MSLAPLDWLVIGAYAVFALWVGLKFAGRAGKDVDEFFLSGRSLPWWIAGTSMVATTFAADTPLVVTGWIREHGLWKNWLWWCLAAGGMLTVFLFARYWRRGGVMTTAELAELRYGGREARLLRGFLGFYHAGVTNALVLCWVLLAASKILGTLFEVDKLTGLVLASALALSYSLLAGFWGVVLTDLVQFVMAMTGSIALAALAWNAIGGHAGLIESGAATGDTLRLFPAVGPGSIFDASFWSINFAALAVYLGVSWWANDAVDGGGPVVQRIAASRSERDGVLGTLWYNVANYALRPWPWFLVALASLVVLPTQEITIDQAAVVQSVRAEELVLAPTEGGTRLANRDPIVIRLPGEQADWRPEPVVKPNEQLAAGAVVARTDSEKAYVVMMMRFLPVGLLGLAVASLLAAFMSTIDTHVNLAASFFINDVYRRFLKPGRSARHYVIAARYASAAVLALGGVMAYLAESISDLYLFFLAFLSGVGPIYALRWLWWRIRASTEITAMVASSISALALTSLTFEWPDTPLSPDGVLAAEGRLCLVVLTSTTCALISLIATRAPDPQTLVAFYRKVRPIGAWGPVRALCPDVARPREALAVCVGTLGGLALTYGILFGIGFTLLNQPRGALVAFGCALVGAAGAAYGVRRLTDPTENAANPVGA